MKAVYISIGSIFVLILIFLIYYSIQLGKAFGWKPPSTELELSESESNWKYQVEKKYNCSFEFIGLDSDFMEDSVIYMNIHCAKNSPLQHKLCDSIELITKKLAQSFVKNSTNRNAQTCIQFTFNAVFCDTMNPPSKYPTIRESFYYIKKDYAINLED